MLQNNGPKYTYFDTGKYNQLLSIYLYQETSRPVHGACGMPAGVAPGPSSCARLRLVYRSCTRLTRSMMMDHLKNHADSTLLYALDPALFIDLYRYVLSAQ